MFHGRDDVTFGRRVAPSGRRSYHASVNHCSLPSSFFVAKERRLLGELGLEVARRSAAAVRLEPAKHRKMLAPAPVNDGDRRAAVSALSDGDGARAALSGHRPRKERPPSARQTSAMDGGRFHTTTP